MPDSLSLFQKAIGRALRWLAAHLALPLATTPIVWGDRARLKIGANVHLANTLLNTRSGSITIEENVFFGHNCLVLTGRHDVSLRDEKRILTVPDSGYDIVIRRGAWIASNVVLIGPCEIGEDSVITASSVVRGVVKSGTIYSGNPAVETAAIRFRE